MCYTYTFEMLHACALIKKRLWLYDLVYKLLIRVLISNFLLNYLNFSYVFKE